MTSILLAAQANGAVSEQPRKPVGNREPPLSVLLASKRRPRRPEAARGPAPTGEPLSLFSSAPVRTTTTNSSSSCSNQRAASSQLRRRQGNHRLTPSKTTTTTARPSHLHSSPLWRSSSNPEIELIDQR